MIQAEPAIRQLLKLDFEPKVKKTISSTFRQTVNQTLKTHLLPMAKLLADEILQQYGLARANLEQILQKEAEEKIAKNESFLSQVNEHINQYNQAVSAINNCLEEMGIYERKLPIVGSYNLVNSEV